MAIMESDLNKIITLIDEGADIDTKYASGSSLLLMAFLYGSFDVIKFLIENTGELEDIQKGLMLLVFLNDINTMSQFLKNGWNADCLVIDGIPLIALSIVYGNLEMTKLFLENGANPNMHFRDMPNLLILPILFGNIEIIKLLLEYGSKIEDDILLNQLLISVANKKIISLFEKYDIHIRDINSNTVLMSLMQDDDITCLVEETEDDIMRMQQEILEKMDEFNSKAETIKEVIVEIKSRKNKDFVSVINDLKDIRNNKLPVMVLNMFNMLYSMFNLRKITKNFISLGGDINAINNKNETALSIAYNGGLYDVVKLLIQEGANVNILVNNKESLYNSVINSRQNKLKSLIENSPTFIKEQHSPQKLVKLLTNFRKDTPIKYTTHIWDMSFKEDYGDFKTYLLRVTEQWNEIEEQLKELSPRLYEKIYNFLLNKDVDSKSWCSKDGDALNIGWSSLEGLEEWCNKGNDPFNFKLTTSYKINNSTITTFGEVITLFKQEIQIRNENNMLENIFIDIEEQLDEQYDGLFEFELVNLKGKTFYTDTEIFRNLLVDRIFKDITKEERHQYNKIKVEIGPNNSLDYHELRIIQIGSQSNQSSHDMLNHHGADTSIIKEGLTNLCDWSIESSSATENYRINYLKSDATLDDIEPLDYKPEGYTHIMRFYK